MKKVLIVVDMQKDFVAGSLGTPEAESIVPNVINKIQNHEGILLFTRDTHKENYLSTQEGRNLPVEHCIKGSDGWEIIDEIKEITADGDTVTFDKDTFGSRDLITYLKMLDETEGIEQIELIGLCTDICVISNSLAIKTYLPEVPIIVDASCCAGVTPESHENALKAMEICQVQVINK